MNLRSVSIGTRLGIGFAIVLALLAFVVIAGNVMSNRSFAQLTLGIDAANAKDALVAKMKSASLEGAIATRNMGLQSDVAAMQKEEAGVKEQRKRYAEARSQLEALGLSDAEKEILSSVERLEQELEKPFKEAVGFLLMFSNDSAAAIIAKRIDPISRRLMSEINKLAEMQQAAAREVRGGMAASMRHLHLLLYLLGAIALTIGIVCAFFITRSITAPLRGAVAIATSVAAGDLSSSVNVAGKDETAMLMQALKHMIESLRTIIGEVRGGTDSISTASREIASGNADLSQRTEEQASSLEETASSMEELTSTVKQNAENARQANQLAASASAVAVKGGRVVSEVVGTMSSINESSKRIVDIISVIDGIAFQTNILALNAAVEAARAGEQGRGFAVVASEVRNLAQRSAAAAKEIKALIGDSVDKVGAGTKLVDEAGKTMQEIVASVKRVTDIMSEITAASQEQSSGIEQVNQAITQMDEVTQQNAALVEQAAAAAEAMQEQAGNLAQAVGVFKLSGAATALGNKFDFEGAVNAHADWKQRLQAFVAGKGEALDAAVVASDNRCALGGWIYGPGKQLAKYSEYESLVNAHASFHRCAGEVVQLSQSGHHEDAKRVLENEFVAESKVTIKRLYEMKAVTGRALEPARQQRGSNRAPNVAGLPGRSAQARPVAKKAAAGGGTDRWAEF